MPKRRYNESTEFVHLGILYDMQIGAYEDGRVGECFLQMSKTTGSFADTTARDVGILISHAIQHGCEIEHLLDSITKDENNKPEGLAGAVLLYLLDWKPKEDGWGSQRVMSAPLEPFGIVSAQEALDIGAPQITRHNAGQFGYTGDQCTSCNSMRMKMAGKCAVCEDCGTSSSCS